MIITQIVIIIKINKLNQILIFIIPIKKLKMKITILILIALILLIPKPPQNYLYNKKNHTLKPKHQENNLIMN